MSSKARILFVLHGWPASESGGTGHVVQALAEAMLAFDFQVAVAAPSNQIVPLSPTSNVVVFPIHVPNPTEWSHTWHQPEVDRQFAKLIQTWQPDVVHIHHLSGLSFGIIHTAKANHARVVLTLHDYAVPCARGQLVNEKDQICIGPSPIACGNCLRHISAIGPGRQRLKSLSRRVPHLSQRVQSLVRRLPGIQPNIDEIARIRIKSVEELFQAIDSLDAPSMDLCNRISAMGYRRPQHSPLPLVHPIQPAPEPASGPVRFLFIGSLIPTKGPARLVQAFQQMNHESATLTLVGKETSYFGSTQTSDFVKQVATLNPHIRLISSVPSKGISELLAAHDVLVLPSSWPENSPLVVREATAAGLRTIVGREGGASELDPFAQTIGPTGIEELGRALEKECQRGRSRHTVREWPTAKAVARWHIVNSYGGSVN